MSNGFNNPYITQDTPFEFDWGDSLLDNPGMHFNLPMYGYQGISPEIMSALSSVFSIGGGDSFSLNALSSGGMDGWGNFMDPVLNIGEGDNPSTLDFGYNLDLGDFGNIGQEYSQELGDLDFEDALPFTDVFDPESLAATLTSMAYGEDYEHGVTDVIRAGEVRALTPEMIEKTTSAYYSPYEESEREDFVTTLGKNLSKVSTGGFAGSNIRTGGVDIARGGYDDSYADLLAQIEKMKGSSTGDIMDIIYGWQEQMSNLT